MIDLPAFTEADAEEFFAELFRGKHHFPGKLKQVGARAWKLSCWKELSTFDYDDLTRLVLLAHKHCMRAQITPAGRHLSILISRRAHAVELDMSEFHPTIEEAIERFEANDHQPWWKWLRDKRESRAEFVNLLREPDAIGGSDGSG